MRGWGLREGNGRTTSHLRAPGDSRDSLECPSLAGVAQGTGATAGSSAPSQAEFGERPPQTGTGDP